MNCQGDPQGITANAISKGDGDVYHAAGLYMAREVWEQGIVVKEEGGDGEPYIMKSLAGGVDGKPGYFEAGMKPGVDNIDHGRDGHELPFCCSINLVLQLRIQRGRGVL